MYLKVENKKLILSVYVVPRSSKTEVVGLYNGSLKIKLKSPPVDNEANEELVKFLAQKLKIPKTNINIVSGNQSKKKNIALSGCTSEYILGIFSLPSQNQNNI